MAKKTLRTVDYLEHMLQAIGRIRTYTAGMTMDAFMANPMARTRS